MDSGQCKSGVEAKGKERQAAGGEGQDSHADEREREREREIVGDGDGDSDGDDDDDGETAGSRRTADVGQLFCCVVGLSVCRWVKGGRG